MIVRQRGPVGAYSVIQAMRSEHLATRRARQFPPERFPCTPWP